MMELLLALLERVTQLHNRFLNKMTNHESYFFRVYKIKHQDNQINFHKF